MNSDSSVNPAKSLVVKPTAVRSDDPWLWNDPSKIVRERLDESVRLRRQDVTRGLRLINLERRAHFFSFMS
jgi:hypothetical protein